MKFEVGGWGPGLLKVICFFIAVIITTNITIKRALCSRFYAEWLNLQARKSYAAFTRKFQGVYSKQTIGNVKYFIMWHLPLYGLPAALGVEKMVKTKKGIAVHYNTFGHLRNAPLCVVHWPVSSCITNDGQRTTNNEQ